MHQIDENKDAAIYNAYMGVDDRGYNKHGPHHGPPPPTHGPHSYYPPPPHHGPPIQRPSHSTKYRQYVSKRLHSDSSLLPQHTTLTRSESTPQRHYPHKTRYRTPYNTHYQSQQHTSPQQSPYYPPSHHYPPHGPPTHHAPPPHGPPPPHHHHPIPPPHGPPHPHPPHPPPPHHHHHPSHPPHSHHVSPSPATYRHGPPHHIPSSQQQQQSHYHGPPGPPSAISSSKSAISSSSHQPHPYDYYSSQHAVKSGQFTPTTPSDPHRSHPSSQHDPYLYQQPMSPYSSHFAAKSDKSSSPVMHIPSKVIPSKAPKSPPPKITEVPSLLSKSKVSKKPEERKSSKPSEIVSSIDIGITKLDDTTLDEPSSDMIDISALPQPKTPKSLQRQCSEPDAKTIRDIERDLNNLPLTPPFHATTDDKAERAGDEIGDVSGLGLPTNLTYAKTTPLSYDQQQQQQTLNNNNDVYGHVNDPYYGTYPAPPPPPNQIETGYDYSRNYGQTGYDINAGYIGYPPQQSYNNNNQRNRQYMGYSIPFQSQQKQQYDIKSGTKRNKKKKKKQQLQQQQQQQQIQQQQQLQQQQLQQMAYFMSSTGFDFAVHDLNQQLNLIKKELSDLEEQIIATDNKTKASEHNLKQTNEEKKKMLDSLKMEKMVLQKSLDIYQDNDDETDKENKNDDNDNIDDYDDEKIRDFWSKQCLSLKKEVDKLRTKNMAASASADVMHKHLRSQLESTRKQLMVIKQQREINRNKNMQFELEVIELTELVNNLKENVDSQRHDNFLKLSKQRERIKKQQQQIMEQNEEENKNDNDDNDDMESSEQLNLIKVATEYPPEIVIQQNLIRAQVEFYFSDYNLKRDKRLLEKICKEPQRGYLSVEEVLSLSRVRQLCNSSSHLYESLKNSPYIDMILSDDEKKKRIKEDNKTKEDTDNNNNNKITGDDNKDNNNNKDIIQYHPLYVGRKHFTPPTEKQFPFRRSVYIYGLPWYADEKYIYSMLNAFGGVTKVHFDHGPDTLDRQIMSKMLEKHRVYKLLSKDSAALTMEFNQMHNKQEQYHCYWCHKQKPCADGYYHPKRIPGTAPTYRVCLQCAAAKAEEQSTKYDARSKLLKDDRRLRELLLGLPPRTIQQCKTALCVFASQRQASKCVYVRSRLAYDGAFATHYHHYSKLKKEIALSIKPKIKTIHTQKQHQQPNMLKTYTAPVYQQDSTAVIQ